MNQLGHLYNINRGCGELTSGDGGYDCDNELTGGTEPILGLINKVDIASVTYSTAIPNLITAITLATGKVMHTFSGYRNSVMPSSEAVENPSGPMKYKHSTNFFILKNTQLIKNQIGRIGKAKLVSVFINSLQDANSFEVQGIRNGLELQAGAINDKAQNSGAYNLIIASRAGQEEPQLPNTWLSTDYAGTLTAFNTLAAIPTVTVISDVAVPAAGGDAETITGTAFFGGGTASDVQSVKWINQSTGAKTTQTAVTVASNTSITFTSVALTAGTYKLEVTTSRGVGVSTTIVTAS